MKSIQMADEKRKKEKRCWEESSWVDKTTGSLMQKVAGNDLLFHLFLRINYAKMLIADIRNFSVLYE